MAERPRWRLRRSGSPVYIQADFPFLIEAHIPSGFYEMVAENLRDMPVIKTMYVSPLFGMLCAHLDDDGFSTDHQGNEVEIASRHGVGIVLPVEVIQAGLN